jgi:hypothetical protein
LPVNKSNKFNAMGVKETKIKKIKIRDGIVNGRLLD